MGLPFLVSSTTRGSTQEEESPYLSLPYSYDVSGETIGATPEGWSLRTGVDGNRLPTVQNSGYLAGANPEVKVLHFDVDADHPSQCNFTLPKPADVSGGIRLAVWGGYANNQNADGFVGLFDTAFASGDTKNGFSAASYRASPYDYKRYCYVNGSGSALTTHSLSQTGYWQSFRSEWKPGTNKLACQLFDWGGTGQWGPYEDSCPSGMDSAFLTASHLYVGCWKIANVYYGDFYLAGFWIGSPADDWPTTGTMFS